MVASAIQTQTVLVDSQSSRTIWHKPTQPDMCIFIPHDKNQASLNNSIQAFKAIMDQRKPSDKELWVLDASALTNLDDLKNSLQALKIDLDDDVYLYQKDPQGIDMNITEIYRVSADAELVMKTIGKWHARGRRKFTWFVDQKWIRRGNFKGAAIRAISLQSGFYIKKMTYLRNGTYNFTGIVPDIVKYLQVCVLHTCAILCVSSCVLPL